MSKEAREFIWRLRKPCRVRLTAKQFRVAMAMADLASAAGECFAGLDVIADEADSDRGNVARTIGQLEALGVFDRKRSKGGTKGGNRGSFGYSTHYWFNYPLADENGAPARQSEHRYRSRINSVVTTQFDRQPNSVVTTPNSVLATFQQCRGDNSNSVATTHKPNRTIKEPTEPLAAGAAGGAGGFCSEGEAADTAVPTDQPAGAADRPGTPGEERVAPAAPSLQQPRENTLDASTDLGSGRTVEDLVAAARDKELEVSARRVEAYEAKISEHQAQLAQFRQSLADCEQCDGPDHLAVRLFRSSVVGQERDIEALRAKIEAEKASLPGRLQIAEAEARNRTATLAVRQADNVVSLPAASPKPAQAVDGWGIEQWCLRDPRISPLPDTAAERLKSRGKWEYHGHVVDHFAKRVAMAAGWKPEWRGDLSLILDWIDKGAKLEPTCEEVEQLAGFMRSTKSRRGPAKTLLAFDNAVCTRRAVA